MDTELALRMKNLIPKEVEVVVESGVKSRRDIEKYMTDGYRSFLIGEALSGAPDIWEAVRNMVKGK